MNLIDRQAECAMLDQLLAVVCAGKSKALCGEAGLGISALLRHLTRRAEHRRVGCTRPCTNHVGRQANSGIASLQLPPRVVDAIALAMGATAVGIGRPYAFALSYGGTESLTHYLNSSLAEFAALKTAGCEPALTAG